MYIGPRPFGNGVFCQYVFSGERCRPPFSGRRLESIGLKKKTRNVHLVVSTHWDREWYETFQGFRYRLVNMLDEVLDTMEENPGFGFFQTDGQSILLEDYLRIRPEREEQIRKLAQEGRLEIGPWYVLSDEFLVSGESLIRNMVEGIRVASTFGKPSSAGFACDIFGHNSQMPQIMRGFGIDSFFLWRGRNENHRCANFRWRGADGSEVLAHGFGPMWGYCDYSIAVRKTREVEVCPTTEELAEGLVEAVRKQAERTSNDTLLLFDGGDHLEIEPRTPEVVEKANRTLEPLGFHVEMSTLSRYVEAIRKEAEGISEVVNGEIREPGLGTDDQWLIPGVLSSRMPLQQANARCENLLCFWAEPFSAIARRYGLSGKDSFLREAWRQLLQNHAHDSICGCSPDQVHKDMEYRFDQCEVIADLVTEDALKQIVRSVPGEVTEKRFPLLVANPLTFARVEPIDITLQIPADGPCYQEFFGFERKPGFRLYDSSGEEIPYQRVAQRLDRTVPYQKRGKFPLHTKKHLVDVTVDLEIPPLGTRTLWVETDEGRTRHPGEGMATGSGSMRNEFLDIEITRFGGIYVEDLENGDIHGPLLVLEDSADIGDGWYHGQAVNDEVFVSDASSAAVSLVCNGPLKTTFRIEVDFIVPSRFDFSEMKRSSERKSLRVTHWVTLRKGVPRIEVVTEVENDVCDHRLRVLFPTHAWTHTYWSDTPFDAVERSIALREDNYRYRELEVETKPQYSWTAVFSAGECEKPCGIEHESEDDFESESEEIWEPLIFDSDRGLAVVSSGLPESSVRDTESREIALTLFRSFRKAIFTDGNHGGQIQGTHRFHYNILPFVAPLDPVFLGEEGQIVAAGIRTIQGNHLDSKLQEVQHPDCFSLVEVDANVIVTSIRSRGEKDLLVRFHCPEEINQPLSIRTADGIARAFICNLLDEPVEEIELEDDRVLLPEVAPKSIVTLLLEVK